MLAATRAPAATRPSRREVLLHGGWRNRPPWGRFRMARRASHSPHRGESTVRFDSNNSPAGNSTTRPRPLDIYLGFEIVRDREDRFIAIPQGWAGAHAP